MNWVSTAIFAASMQAVVSIIDSHLLARRMIGLKAFILVMGIIQLIYSFLLYLFFPWPTSMPFTVILAVIGAGICGATAVLITLFVLEREEVSKVIPISNTSPIFVAIIAAVMLGETIIPLQWAAIFIVVVGAMMITAEKSGVTNTGRLKKPVLLLFIASLSGAIGTVLCKYAMTYISYWNTYSMALTVASIEILVIAFRTASFRQWIDMPRRTSSLALLVLDEFMALSASVIYMRAISLGPVSLVSAVMTVRQVLVMVFSVILSFVLPGFLIESAGKRVLVIRFIAITLIVGGLSIISLTGE